MTNRPRQLSWLTHPHSNGEPTVVSSPLLTLRRYALADRSDCLDLFASNVPALFRQSDGEAFTSFLDELPGPFFVVEREGRILACGGYVPSLDEPGFDLCWGMVRKGLRRRGLSRLMLLFRVGHLLRDAGNSTVNLHTSQFTYRELSRMGFKLSRVQKDGYGLGLHRYRVSLSADDDLRVSVLRELRKMKERVLISLDGR